MQVENSLYPNPDQMAGFQEPDDGQPIYMVNLLKYRDHAIYEDGRETSLTGREAYALYADGVRRLLDKVGGQVLFNSTVQRLVIGSVEDLWDDVAIAMYPSREAMLNMMLSPEMAEISVHRAAGLDGQLNIETVDQPI